MIIIENRFIKIILKKHLINSPIEGDTGGCALIVFIPEPSLRREDLLTTVVSETLFSSRRILSLIILKISNEIATRQRKKRLDSRNQLVTITFCHQE